MTDFEWLFFGVRAAVACPTPDLRAERIGVVSQEQPGSNGSYVVLDSRRRDWDLLEGAVLSATADRDMTES